MKTIALTLLALFVSVHSALADNAFSAQFRCIEALGGGISKLNKNTKDPKTDTHTSTFVGYMVEGKNAGRNGFYVYRDNEAYFVKYPKKAKQVSDPKNHEVDPAIYIWARIPKTGRSEGTDNFQITLKNGRIDGVTDEIDSKRQISTYTDNDKVFKKHMITSKGTDVIGEEARGALTAQLRKLIDQYPTIYQSDVNNAKNDSEPVPAVKSYTDALNACSNVEEGKLKDAIAQAREKIDPSTSRSDGLSGVVAAPVKN